MERAFRLSKSYDCLTRLVSTPQSKDCFVPHSIVPRDMPPLSRFVPTASHFYMHCDIHLSRDNIFVPLCSTPIRLFLCFSHGEKGVRAHSNTLLATWIFRWHLTLFYTVLQDDFDLLFAFLDKSHTRSERVNPFLFSL